MVEFDGSGLVFAAIGLATLAAALLPRLLGRVPISMPMVFLASGMLAFTVFHSLPNPAPSAHPEFALHFTEVTVIVALMGAGLAINRPPGLHRWSSTWRLLGITMPVSIAAVAVLGGAWLGLGLAASILMAAALAPTDPVLATEVQVSEPIVDPSAAEDDEARFALTSEAGFNDGLAFPFTWLAISVSLAGGLSGGLVAQWILVDVLWRSGVGVGVGMLTGWLLGKLFFSARSERLALTEKAEGFVALAATFLAYGLAEAAEGYGFVAVFVCALAVRAAEREHGYHTVLHKFVEQIERLLTVAVVVLLGGAIARGGLDGIGWREVAFALAVLLLVRPLAGWIGLSPGKTGPRERAVISFFGVRGVGSLFYIAFAVLEGDFAEAEAIWSIVLLVVAGSILIHGIAATPAMLLLDRRRVREVRAHGGTEDEIPTTPV